MALALTPALSSCLFLGCRLGGGPVSYSWSLHLPLPLPMFYRLYGTSEGKALLAKAKPRHPPVPGTPFDLILGNHTHT